MMSRLKDFSKSLGMDMLSDTKKYSKDLENQIELIKKRNEEQSKISKIQTDPSTLRTQEAAFGLISQARSYTSDSGGQFSFINEQIGLTQKRNEISRRQEESKAREKFRDDDEGLKKALTDISSRYESEDMQTKLLRELIDTIKLTSKEEIAEDRKSVQRTVNEFSRDPSKFSPEDQLKLSYQQELLSPNRGVRRQGIMGQVFTGTFLANSLQNALSQLGNVVSARDEEQAVQSLISALPGIGGISGATYGRSREEQLAYGQSLGRFGAITGRNMSTLGRFSRFGFTGTESMDMLSPAFQAAGGQVNALNYVSAVRGLGIDQGTLNQSLRLGRVSGQNDVQNTLLRILGVMEEQGIDRSLLQEVLENQNQFTAQAQAINPMFTSQTANRIFGEFGQIGGIFSQNNPQFANYISTFQQSLSNPNNDLMQAENFAILREMFPQARASELIAMQEQGLAVEGFGQRAVGRILDRFGEDSDSARIAVAQRTGLSQSVVNKLFEEGNISSFVEGKTSFSDITSDLNIQREAVKRTNELDASAAEITDLFATNMNSANAAVELTKKTFLELNEAAIGFKDVMKGLGLFPQLGSTITNFFPSLKTSK